MEETTQTPAIFNGKDLSIDFLESFADGGKIILNEPSDDEQTGLFFYCNSPVAVFYSRKNNHLSFRFTEKAQKQSFEIVFKRDFIPDYENPRLVVDDYNLPNNEILYYFWWE